MGDLLETGLGWLADQFKAHASRDVTYQRGALEAVVRATVGRTEFELADDHGGVTRFESRDFLILAADLVLGATATLPQYGDHIVETQGALTFIYQVLDQDGRPLYRFSDPYRKLLRIHTKRVA
jgi:hypothetical protein